MYTYIYIYIYIYMYMYIHIHIAYTPKRPRRKCFDHGATLGATQLDPNPSNYI